jgi:hypothetical protein
VYTIYGMSLNLILLLKIIVAWIAIFLTPHQHELNIEHSKQIVNFCISIKIIRFGRLLEI